MSNNNSTTSKPALIGAIYGRVSVDEAAEVEHGSLEQQKHMGMEFARLLSHHKNIEHNVKYILIEDRGVSGKNTNRPKYQELIKLVESKRIDFVIAKEISRISRSTKDFCEFLNLCKENKVAVHIRGMDADPNSPMGEMIFKIFAMIAEFERQQIVERTKSSIRSSIRNNSKINGGSTPLGFDRDINRKGFYIINNDEIQQVIYLMEMFNKTISFKQTYLEARRKGIKNKNGNDFNKNTIRRMLSNPKYIGKLSIPNDDGDNQEFVDMLTGAVVPIELYQQVQENIFKLNGMDKNTNRHSRRIYPLTGVLVYEDNTKFAGTSGTSRSGEVIYYYRNNKNDVTLSAPVVEKAVLSALRIYENDARMLEYANNIQKKSYSHVKILESQQAKLVKQLKLLDEKESKLGDVLIGGLNKDSHNNDGANNNVAEFVSKQLSSIAKERMELNDLVQQNKKELDAWNSSKLTANELKKSLKCVFDKLEQSDDAVRRAIYRKLFDRIIVHSDRSIKIVWSVEVGGVSMMPLEVDVIMAAA